MTGPAKVRFHERSLSVEDRRARARELRAQGLKLREIGERMGYSLKTVHQWLSDPDGSKLKARQDSYRGTCRECGGQTTGCRGPSNAPDLCIHCSARALGLSRRLWTTELVIERMREWANTYGDPPATADWDPHNARIEKGDEVRARRFEDADGHWPTAATVVRLFGRWNVALEAAGFASRVPHGGGGNVARRRSQRARAAA